MNCEDAREMMHPYLDRELDFVRSIEVERHLERCEECSRLLFSYRSLQDTIREGQLYFRTPEELKKRIRKAVGQAGPRRIFSVKLAWRDLAIATALAAVIFGVWRFAGVVGGPGGGDRLTQEILQSHIRSLMVDHLTDIPSTDRHTVKPWFNGKVDFSPEVRDLSSEGFLLVGGRLEYIGGRAVAAIVYQRRKHVINLFTWTGERAGDHGPIALTRDGYHLLGWYADGMAYCAVSDLSENELQQFVMLFKSPPAGAGSPK